MERLNTPRYNDFWWDLADPEERNEAVLKEQAIPTAVFAKNNVPFYMEHYKKISNQDIQNISSFGEFIEVIPYVTKEHLATNHPMAFLPQTGVSEVDPHKGKYWRFGTGGTTGKPILIMHSVQDWRGMTLTANRHIEFDFYKDENFRSRFQFNKGTFTFFGIESRLTPLYSAGIMGAYNADHITNGIYATMLHRLGCDFYWRPSAAPSIEDIFESTQQFKVNGILAPPEGESKKKGSFLRDILEQDSRNTSKSAWKLSHRYNDKFKFIFWSSMPISEDLLNHLIYDRQIPYIKGHFGSTEVCPTAATCSHKMRTFHLVHGHSLVLIKKLKKDELAEPDELGYTLVSKIGASDKEGNNVLPSGMIFINYMPGDGARLSKNGLFCKCGRNTSILYDLQRVEFHKGKAKHGCQVD